MRVGHGRTAGRAPPTAPPAASALAAGLCCLASCTASFQDPPATLSSHIWLICLGVTISVLLPEARGIWGPTELTGAAGAPAPWDGAACTFEPPSPHSRRPHALLSFQIHQPRRPSPPGRLGKARPLSGKMGTGHSHPEDAAPPALMSLTAPGRGHQPRHKTCSDFIYMV